MNKLVHIAMAGTLLIFVAAAQDTEAGAQESQMKVKVDAEAHAGMFNPSGLFGRRYPVAQGAIAVGAQVDNQGQALWTGNRDLGSAHRLSTSQ